MLVRNKVLKKRMMNKKKRDEINEEEMKYENDESDESEIEEEMTNEIEEDCDYERKYYELKEQCFCTHKKSEERIILQEEYNKI